MMKMGVVELLCWMVENGKRWIQWEGSSLKQIDNSVSRDLGGKELSKQSNGCGKSFASAHAMMLPGFVHPFIPLPMTTVEMSGGDVTNSDKREHLIGLERSADVPRHVPLKPFLPGLMLSW